MSSSDDVTKLFHFVSSQPQPLSKEQIEYLNLQIQSNVAESHAALRGEDIERKSEFLSTLFPYLDVETISRLVFFQIPDNTHLEILFRQVLLKSIEISKIRPNTLSIAYAIRSCYIGEKTIDDLSFSKYLVKFIARFTETPDLRDLFYHLSWCFDGVPIGFDDPRRVEDLSWTVGFNKEDIISILSISDKRPNITHLDTFALVVKYFGHRNSYFNFNIMDILVSQYNQHLRNNDTPWRLDRSYHLVNISILFNYYLSLDPEEFCSISLGNFLLNIVLDHFSKIGPINTQSFLAFLLNHLIPFFRNQYSKKQIIENLVRKISESKHFSDIIRFTRRDVDKILQERLGNDTDVKDMMCSIVFDKLSISYVLVRFNSKLLFKPQCILFCRVV